MPENAKKPQIRFKGFTDDWEQCKLGEVYFFEYGQFNNNPSNGGIYPVFGANGIIGYYSKYNAENSIIIGHMGEYAGSVLWGEGKHFVTYNGTITLPKLKNIIPKYGYYMLLRTDIRKTCGGSGLPFLSYEMLQKLDFQYPKNCEEQIKIKDFLEKLDNLITLHQRKLEKLKNIKKSMLEKMFPKNGSNIPEIRFKGFTDAWEQRKLGEVADIYDGTHQTPKYTDDGVMFLSVENIKNLTSDKFISKEDFKKNFKIYPQYGDILLTRIGDVGTANVVDKKCDLAYYVSLALLKLKNSHPYFIKENIHSKQVQKDIWEKTLHIAFPKKINKIEIEKVIIFKPTNKYEEIKIGELFYNIDNLITLHQRKLEKLQNIKKACLEKMFV